MSFKNKYLKYKQKYLELKKLYGGFEFENPMPISTRLNIKRLDDLTFINETNINLISNNDHILVPMNSFQTVDKNNEDIFSTTGLVDCVGIAIYNKNFGRYFAHYLKFNEFCEDLTNACEAIGGDNEECIRNLYFASYPDPGPLCDNDSIKIKSSIPYWVKENGTIINIFSQAENFKIISRYNQLNRIILENKGLIINLYFNKLEGDDNSFNFLGAERDRIVTRLQLPISEDKVMRIAVDWDFENNQPIYKERIYVEIFLFDKNGKLYTAKQISDLNGNESLRNFYNSKTVKIFTSFHNSKKCVKRYSLKKSFYESNKIEFDAKDSINIGEGWPTNSPYHQSILRILNGE